MSRKIVHQSHSLPEDIERALLHAQTEIAPPEERKAALKASILERISTTPQGRNFITVRAEDEGWIEIAPKVERKMLMQDALSCSFLLRLRAGATLPGHEHPTDEECLLLEGDLRLGSIELHSGDYHLAPAGRPHGAISSRGGALLYIRSGIEALQLR
ncbi:MAG: cupin domain-containing protein [Burkholderiales bacterium]|nr:cupin domain-containing protein [Burkholderiales bacterium]